MTDRAQHVDNDKFRNGMLFIRVSPGILTANALFRAPLAPAQQLPHGRHGMAEGGQVFYLSQVFLPEIGLIVS